MSRVRTAVLVVAVLVVAANLRPSVVAVSPLVGQIRADLGVNSTVAGLITTLPVLCFGLLAPIAGRLTRRFSLEGVLLGALLLLTTGILVRLAPPLAALLVGSVLAGSAIAVGNTLMPVLVKRDFQRHTGPMTGAYSTVISAGGALAAGVMVPVEHATGLSWRPSLALWAIFAAVAIALWTPFTLRALRARRDTRARADHPVAPPAPAVRGLWRSPLAWQVTLVMGLQSLQFYSTAAWIPTLFVDAGRTPSQAGLLLSLAGLASLPSSYVTPVLAARRPTQFHLLATLLALLVAGYLGLLLAPTTLSALWMILIGLGQGVGISLGLTLITLRAPDAAHTSELSGMAQGVGYCIAAVGPLGLGAIHDLTHGWTVPLIVLLVLLAPLAIAGLGAARNRHVGRPAPTPDVPPEPSGTAEPAGTGEGPVDGQRALLRGRVHSTDGAGLGGATVTLVDDRGQEVGRTRSGIDGAFTLAGPGASDADARSGVAVCAAAEHEPVAWRTTPGGYVDVELPGRVPTTDADADADADEWITRP